MSKTFKYDKQDQQTKGHNQNGYNQTSKKAKLTKQQAGRMEKQFLRSCSQANEV